MPWTKSQLAEQLRQRLDDGQAPSHLILQFPGLLDIAHGTRTFNGPMLARPQVGTTTEQRHHCGPGAPYVLQPSGATALVARSASCRPVSPSRRGLARQQASPIRLGRSWSPHLAHVASTAAGFSSDGAPVPSRPPIQSMASGAPAKHGLAQPVAGRYAGSTAALGGAIGSSVGPAACQGAASSTSVQPALAATTAAASCASSAGVAHHTQRYTARGVCISPPAAGQTTSSASMPPGQFAGQPRSSASVPPTPFARQTQSSTPLSPMPATRSVVSPPNPIQVGPPLTTRTPPAWASRAPTLMARTSANSLVAPAATRVLQNPRFGAWDDASLLSKTAVATSDVTPATAGGGTSGTLKFGAVTSRSTAPYSGHRVVPRVVTNLTSSRSLATTGAKPPPVSPPSATRSFRTVGRLQTMPTYGRFTTTALSSSYLPTVVLASNSEAADLYAGAASDSGLRAGGMSSAVRMVGNGSVELPPPCNIPSDFGIMPISRDADGATICSSVTASPTFAGIRACMHGLDGTPHYGDPLPSPHGAYRLMHVDLDDETPVSCQTRSPRSLASPSRSNRAALRLPKFPDELTGDIGRQELGGTHAPEMANFHVTVAAAAAEDPSPADDLSASRGRLLPTAAENEVDQKSQLQTGAAVCEIGLQRAVAGTSPALSLQAGESPEVPD